MRKRICTILLCLAFATPGIAAESASPEGFWRTAGGNGIIEIVRCGADDTMCGKIAWFRIKPDDPNPQGVDLKNPDLERRSRSLCGLIFMYAFKPAAPGHWDHGRVYDAESGNTYDATMTLRTDGKLDLHGYIGISLLGRSEIWTRFTQPVPSCPGH
jgi:uncharacterized protein (DUF2147 family)